MPLFYCLSDVFKRLEIYDDTYLLDDTYGFDTSCFTQTQNPFANLEARDTLEDLTLIKTQSDEEVQELDEFSKDY